MPGKGGEGEGILEELVEGTKEKGYIINSRFVSEVWKIGLDMKDICDKKVVEKIVNDLMVDKREGLLKSASKFAKLAKECVSVGGSSNSNLDRLIEDIRLMKKNCRK
ncbi:hypothetical protein DITRI_Ditri02bG0133200 [Diplodiscus trichospermus]